VRAGANARLVAVLGKADRETAGMQGQILGGSLQFLEIVGHVVGLLVQRLRGTKPMSSSPANTTWMSMKTRWPSRSEFCLVLGADSATITVQPLAPRGCPPYRQGR